MKRFILTLLALWALSVPALAQNVTCPDRPGTDSSNACANTRFVKTNGGGGGGPCTIFTSSTPGCVPSSGGGTINYLRADGTWTQPDSVAIGTILPWAGATVPNGYLLAYGQEITRLAYPDLLTALTFSPLISCTSGSPTVTVSIEITNRVKIGTPVEAAACFTSGTTVVSKTSTTLTFNRNAITTTSTTARIFPWGNGNGTSSFNVPNLAGRSLLGRDNMAGAPFAVITSTYFGADPDTLGSSGGVQSTTLVTGNLPAYTPTGTVTGTVTINDPGHTHPVTQNNYWTTAGCPGCGIGGGGDFGAAGTTSIGVGTAFTGITASTSGLSMTGNAQGGSSLPFSNILPSMTVDFIIKAFLGPVSGGGGGGGSVFLTVGVSTISGGANTNILYDNAGILGEYTLSTANQYNCATPGTIVTPGVVYQSETTTTFGATTIFDFCTFKNTKVTLTGNITTQTFNNVVAGKAGMITFIQDGTGGRTTVWNSILKFTGGSPPALTATANAVDILTYACRSPTFCGASLLTDVR